MAPSPVRQVMRDDDPRHDRTQRQTARRVATVAAVAFLVATVALPTATALVRDFERPPLPGEGTTVAVESSCSEDTQNDSKYNCSGTFVVAYDGVCQVEWEDTDADADYQDDDAHVESRDCKGGIH